MICVSISFIVTGNNVKKDPIFLIGFQIGEATSYRWKHPPKMKCRKLNVAFLKYSAYSFSIKWQVLKVYQKSK